MDTAVLNLSHFLINHLWKYLQNDHWVAQINDESRNIFSNFAFMKCSIKFGACIGMIQGDRQFNHVAFYLNTEAKNSLRLNLNQKKNLFWNASLFFVGCQSKFSIFNKPLKAFDIFSNISRKKRLIRRKHCLPEFRLRSWISYKSS